MLKNVFIRIISYSPEFLMKAPEITRQNRRIKCLIIQEMPNEARKLVKVWEND